MAITLGSVRGRHGTYEIEDRPEFRPSGSAHLYAVTNRQELLYKRFHTPLAARHEPRISELVRVGRETRSQSGLRLDVQRVAWPVDLVVECRLVAGVLIPRARPEFFRPATRAITQTLTHLASSGAPPVRERLTIVAQLAGALALLDRHGLVHGDISGGNVLWAAKPSPSMLLIDCDTLHPRDFEMPPYHTEYWTDPRLRDGSIDAHDTMSDRYALALAVFRAIVLDPRATPLPSEIAWLHSELPRSLAEPLADTFAAPLGADTRAHPDTWREALESVAATASDCRRLTKLTSKLPDSVAERRAMREQAASPRTPRPAPRAVAGGRLRRPPAAPAGQRPRDAGGVAARPMSSHRRARRWPRRLVLCLVLAVLAVFTLYHLTGLPNWRILNTLNPFLSHAQRSLVAALPAAVKDCAGGPTVPSPGVLATVRCEWDGRELIALRFTNLGAMDAYYRRRRAAGTRFMASHRMPSACPRAGRWRYAGQPHGAGYATAFISSLGARLDWSDSASLTYRIGLGSAAELAALCTWWRSLIAP